MLHTIVIPLITSRRNTVYPVLIHCCINLVTHTSSTYSLPCSGQLHEIPIVISIIWCKQRFWRQKHNQCNDRFRAEQTFIQICIKCNLMKKVNLWPFILFLFLFFKLIMCAINSKHLRVFIFKTWAQNVITLHLIYIYIDSIIWNSIIRCCGTKLAQLRMYAHS